MKAVALLCARCSGRLLATPGVAVGVCNACSTAYDFATGEKHGVPIEEVVATHPPDTALRRLPFVRFEASGAGSAAPVFVMAFAIGKIGSPFDDGSKLTMDGRSFETRSGGLDQAPELTVATAAGLARFLALRRLDPDGRANLRATAVQLGKPSILAMPFRVTAGGLQDPITGLILGKELVH